MTPASLRTKTRIIVAGWLAFLAIAETGARIAGPLLPEPLTWPSLEAQIKSGQIEAMAGSPHFLVLLGDSTMEAGLDPAALEASGIAGRVYNAALPFSTPLSIEAWATGFVLPRLDPNVVIVGLGAYSPQTTKATDPLRAGLLEAISATQGKSTLEASLSNWSALYRYRRSVRAWGLPGGLPDVDGSEPLMSEQGFQTGYHRGLITATNESELDPVSLSAPHMSPDNEQALETLLSEILARGARPLLLFEPVQCHGDSETCRSNLEDSPYRQRAKEIANSLGVEVLDANTEKWSPDLFFDSTHLNRNGSDQLVDWLVGQLDSLDQVG